MLGKKRAVLGPTKFWVQKGLKNIWVPKKFWVQKNFWPKKFLVKKNVGPKDF